MSNFLYQFYYVNEFTNPANTLTATSSAAGFDISNLTNWLPWSRWKASTNADQSITLTLPASQTFTSLCIYGHNIATSGATVTLQWWNGAAFVNIGAFSTATPDNSPQVMTFASQAATIWRLHITGASVPFILSVVYLGSSQITDVADYVGVSDPQIADMVDILTNISDSAAFLGRSVISRGQAFTVKLEYLTPFWAKDTGVKIMRHLQANPCFINWPFNVGLISGFNVVPTCFAWHDGTNIAHPVPMSPTYYTWTLKMRGNVR